MIPITWSFAAWRLDLVGPLKKALGGCTHLLVAIDKFTKWILAWPIVMIGSEQTVEFFLNITHHFGVPNSIIMDNGTRFIGKKVLEFYDDYHIRVDWATVAHPHTNGQVEHVNNMIAGRWVAGLPTVLWSLRMTQLSDRLHPSLHGLRFRGGPPDQPRLWSTER
jgi:IS30 family transposase